LEASRPPLIAQIAAVAAVLVALVLLLAPVPFWWLGGWQGQLLDFGHVPLFAVLVLLLWAGTPRPHYRAVLATLALSVVVEIIQPYFGRTRDVADVLRGALGTFCGTSIALAWESRGSRIRVATYLILAVLFPAWPIVEVTPYLLDTVEARQTFPVLATFSTEHEVRRWESKQSILCRTGDPALRVDFLTGPAEYPGAALNPVLADFRGYRWLCAEFEVVDAPLELAISVQTRSSNPHLTTHTDVERRYPPGNYTVRLDLAVMAAAGDPEPLDLSDVHEVIFFALRLQEPRTIVLSRVWLER
jgi:hypothetical protein